MFVNNNTSTQNPFGGKDVKTSKFSNVTVPGNILTIMMSLKAGVVLGKISTSGTTGCFNIC